MAITACYGVYGDFGEILVCVKSAAVKGCRLDCRQDRYIDIALRRYFEVTHNSDKYRYDIDTAEGNIDPSLP